MHEKTDLPQPGVWHIPGSGQTTITIDLVHEYNKIHPSDRAPWTGCCGGLFTRRAGHAECNPL